MTGSRPTLFLDTTIQIERVVGSRARQAALQRELAGYELMTSTYVLGEYTRTLVRDAVQFHNLVLAYEHMDDVMTAIAQHRNKREGGRMMLLWANLLRERVYSRAHALDTLELYIEMGLVNRFLTGMDEVLGATECSLAQERPTPVGEAYHLRAQCTRRVKECALPERLAGEWRDGVAAVASGLCDHSDPALDRMGRLAQRILDDPDTARGRNCTWYLGDLIIALECPPEAALYTTNRRHFEPLCALLGKRLHRPEVDRDHDHRADRPATHRKDGVIQADAQQ